MIGLSLSLTRSGWFSDLASAIRALFQSGEQGVWYDPSDFSTLYQDSAGTTPATAVGQVVGLMLDKSQGLVLGSELTTNGDFSDGATGWSIVGANVSISGGRATWASAAANERITQGALTATKTYICSFDVVDYTSGTVYFVGGGASTTGTGHYEAILTGQTQVYIRAGGAGFTGSIDNVSVRELPGNHATQATTANKPILARHPVTGKRNMMTYSEQIDNGNWADTFSGTGLAPVTSANAGQAPDGLTTAERIQLSLSGGTTTSDISRRRQSVTIAAGDHTFSVYLRSYDGVSTYNAHLTDAAGATRNIVITGTYQRFEVAATGVAGALLFSIGLRGGQTPANSNTADILAWGAQVERGSSATAYQKTTTVYDTTEEGVANLHYLKFDGVDDFMVTPSIDFSATDKMSVFAGLQMASIANRAMLVELSASIASNAGTFEMEAPYAGGGIRNQLRGDGVNGTYFNHLGVVLVPYVESCVHDISGSTAATEIFPRLNGAIPTLTIGGDASAGAGNFGNYPLYIGRRGGASLPFAGNLYSLVARGALSDAAQIAAAESYVNSKTKAY